jgi:dTDP-4-dehydrorhamnose reductase
MSIYVVGYRGRLGSELLKHEGVLPLDVNVTDLYSVQDGVRNLQHEDVIINCAAVTDVDKCEEQATFEQAIRVAVNGNLYLRDFSKARIIYISTDYVFDGKHGPYREDRTPNSVNAYGLAKLAGESIMQTMGHFGDTIVRISCPFGGNKDDFLSKVVRKLKDEVSVEAPDDLIGSPYYVGHIAEALIQLCKNYHLPRIIHISSGKSISRAEFARRIAVSLGLDWHWIQPTEYRRLEGIALRPKRCGLKNGWMRKLEIPIHTIEEGLEECMKENNYVA